MSPDNGAIFSSSPWTEIVGTLRCLSVEADIIYVKVGGMMLELRNNEGTAAYVQEMRGLIGKRVAILRTDMPEKPFLIRLVRSDEEKKARSKVTSDE